MKKWLIVIFTLTSVVAMAESETHMYGKIGVDLSTKYSPIKEEGETIFKSEKGTGFGVFVEGTMNVHPNLELGTGAGFIGRANGKNGTFVDKEENYSMKYNTPRYNSIPIYALAKYNFDVTPDVKAYLKTDLGISLNQDKSLDVTFEKTKVGTVEMKVKSGIYAGIGAGIEYKHFIAELSYHYTQAKMHFEMANLKSKRVNYDNHAVSLAVGYKFF